MMLMCLTVLLLLGVVPVPSLPGGLLSTGAEDCAVCRISLGKMFWTPLLDWKTLNFTKCFALTVAKYIQDVIHSVESWIPRERNSWFALFVIPIGIPNQNPVGWNWFSKNSNWIECSPILKYWHCTALVSTLRSGLCSVIQTEQGSNFTSWDFAQVLKQLTVHHVLPFLCGPVQCWSCLSPSVPVWWRCPDWECLLCCALWANVCCVGGWRRGAGVGRVGGHCLC